MGKICSRIENEFYAEEGSFILPSVRSNKTTDGFEMTKNEDQVLDKYREENNHMDTEEDKVWSKAKRNHYEDNKIQNTMSKPKV